MHGIDKPEVLDPDRVNRDKREQLSAKDEHSMADLLEQALRESCEYADQLWEQLDAVRGYLMQTLPEDPYAPGPHRRVSARPTGPDDDEGWQAWIATYAETASVLCGRHGDSGFGLSVAEEQAQRRRDAPELKVRPQQVARARQAHHDQSSGGHRAKAVIKAAGAAAAGFLAAKALHGRGSARPVSGSPRQG